MSFIMIRCAVVAVAGFLFLVPPPASAQTSPDAQGQSQAPSSNITGAGDVTDQKIDAVAAAVEKVARVEQDYSQQFAQAPAADRQRVLDEAQSQMVKAVTDQGLSVEEYGKIMEFASKDPDLRQKILDRIASR